MAFNKILIILFLIGSSAFGKPITLQWKPIQNAVKYDLEILDREERIYQETIKANSGEWKRDMDPGYYVYRVRATDRDERVGMWTEYFPLIVTPPAPDLETPTPRQEIENSTVKFSWAPIGGVDRYEFEVKKNGNPFFKRSVSTNTVTLRGMETADYTWSVVAWVEKSQKLPKVFSKEKIGGERSEVREFFIISERLDTPAIEMPLGELDPKTTQKYRFAWSAVEGAQFYELKIKTNREPASEGEKRWVLATNELTVDLPPGQYSWSVRALASEKPNARTSADSNASFQIRDVPAGPDRQRSHVLLSAAANPFQYSYAPVSRQFATSSGSAFSAGGEGVYWWGERFGLQIEGALTFYAIDGASFANKDVGAGLGWKIALSEENGWHLHGAVGPGLKDYFIMARPTGQSQPSIRTLSALGLDASATLTKYLSDELSHSVVAGAFAPLAIISGFTGNEALTSVMSYQNFRFGTYLEYWFANAFAARLGAYLERRTLSWNGGGTQPSDTIALSNFRISAALSYAF